MMVLNDFIRDYGDFRATCNTMDYRDVKNPIDGIVYHGIALDLPEIHLKQVINDIEESTKANVARHISFLRLSKSGTEVPNGVHQDSSLGRYALICYLNEPEHCAGGTSLVHHKDTGLNGKHNDDKQRDVIIRDHKDYDAWIIDEFIDMQSNKAFIFESCRFHRAEPPVSFGDDIKTGRLTLSVFFDLI